MSYIQSKIRYKKQNRNFIKKYKTLIPSNEKWLKLITNPTSII